MSTHRCSEMSSESPSLVMSNVRILIKPQASVIDVLATLFFLSCTKCFVNILLTFRTSELLNITAQPPVTLKMTPLIDVTYSYLGTQHIIYMTITALMLPPLAVMFPTPRLLSFQTLQKSSCLHSQEQHQNSST